MPRKSKAVLSSTESKKRKSTPSRPLSGDERCFCHKPVRTFTDKNKEVWYKCGTTVDWKNKETTKWGRGCPLYVRADKFDVVMELIHDAPRFKRIPLEQTPLSESEFPICEQHQCKLKMGISQKADRPYAMCGVGPPNESCGVFFWLDEVDNLEKIFPGDRAEDYEWIAENSPDLKQVIDSYLKTKYGKVVPDSPVQPKKKRKTTPTVVVEEEMEEEEEGSDGNEASADEGEG